MALIKTFKYLYTNKENKSIHELILWQKK